MNKPEQPNIAGIDREGTLKIKQVESRVESNKQDESQAKEQLQMAEDISSQLKELSENSLFVDAADKFIEIMDSSVMVPVKKTWDLVPAGGQDAFIASRYIPNPAYNMLPHLTKLMTDIGFLERKGIDSEEAIAKANENEAKLDAFLLEFSGVLPGGESFKPLIDKIIQGKKGFNEWIKDRRTELKQRRLAKLDNDQIDAIRASINRA